MLIDAVLLCAPAVVVSPAVVALLTRPGVPGGTLICNDVDRQTLHVAYLARYPQRSREVVHLGLIGGSYLLWWGGAALLALLIGLGAIAVAALWFDRALLNFDRNDDVSRELFVHLGAPDGLIRPRTELVGKAPPRSVDTVFARAADVRDARVDGSMTTLAAVNASTAASTTVRPVGDTAVRLTPRQAGVSRTGSI